VLLAPLDLRAQFPRFPQLVPVSTYDTGLGEQGAEIISVRESDQIAALTNVAGSIDILTLADPTNVQLLRRITVDPSLGTPNSVALHPSQDYLLVVTGTAGNVGKLLAYRISDGALLATASTGIQPDSVAISPDGRFAVIANEAEGAGTGNNGGDGSLSVVNLLAFQPDRANPFLQVFPIALSSQAGTPGFSTGRTDDLARLPIDNTPATLEPESVTFSSDSRFAYVTLQENSGVVRLDLQTLTLTYFGLGQTSHVADLTNGDGYNPNQVLTAFRESDGIALTPGNLFFVTADEGDSRDAAGSSGPRGGRTVSIFNASTGQFIADTANQLDEAANVIGAYPDNRSNRGGSEPEVLDVGTFRGRTLVAVGLERANAVALVDITVPRAPLVVSIAPTGTAPEGIKFFRLGDRLTGRLFVLSANEVAGTVSVLEVVAPETAGRTR